MGTWCAAVKEHRYGPAGEGEGYVAPSSFGETTLSAHRVLPNRLIPVAVYAIIRAILAQRHRGAL